MRKSPPSVIASLCTHEQFGHNPLYYTHKPLAAYRANPLLCPVDKTQHLIVNRPAQQEALLRGQFLQKLPAPGQQILAHAVTQKTVVANLYVSGRQDMLHEAADKFGHFNPFAFRYWQPRPVVCLSAGGPFLRRALRSF